MITAFRNPTTLTFEDYEPRASIIDPNDASISDAFTSFDFELLPNLPAERHNGRFRLSRSMSLSITPVALIRDDAAATDPGMPSLLSHEQLHYDVGFVIARQLARELNVIDAATERGLKDKLDELIELHFHTRARLIQTRYDREANHGANHHFQRLWKANMAKCLADPHAHQIGGWML